MERQNVGYKTSPVKSKESKEVLDDLWGKIQGASITKEKLGDFVKQIQDMELTDDVPAPPPATTRPPYPNHECLSCLRGHAMCWDKCENCWNFPACANQGFASYEQCLVRVNCDTSKKPPKPATPAPVQIIEQAEAESEAEMEAESVAEVGAEAEGEAEMQAEAEAEAEMEAAAESGAEAEAESEVEAETEAEVVSEEKESPCPEGEVLCTTQFGGLLKCELGKCFAIKQDKGPAEEETEDACDLCKDAGTHCSDKCEKCWNNFACLHKNFTDVEACVESECTAPRISSSLAPGTLPRTSATTRATRPAPPVVTRPPRPPRAADTRESNAVPQLELPEESKEEAGAASTPSAVLLSTRAPEAGGVVPGSVAECTLCTPFLISVGVSCTEGECIPLPPGTPVPEAPEPKTTAGATKPSSTAAAARSTTSTPATTRPKEALACPEGERMCTAILSQLIHCQPGTCFSVQDDAAGQDTEAATEEPTQPPTFAPTVPECGAGERLCTAALQPFLGCALLSCVSVSTTPRPTTAPTDAPCPEGEVLCVQAVAHLIGCTENTCFSVATNEPTLAPTVPQPCADGEVLCVAEVASIIGCEVDTCFRTRTDAAAGLQAEEPAEEAAEQEVEAEAAAALEVAGEEEEAEAEAAQEVQAGAEAVGTEAEAAPEAESEAEVTEEIAAESIQEEKAGSEAESETQYEYEIVYEEEEGDAAGTQANAEETKDNAEETEGNYTEDEEAKSYGKGAEETAQTEKDGKSAAGKDYEYEYVYEEEGDAQEEKQDETTYNYDYETNAEAEQEYRWEEAAADTAYGKAEDPYEWKDPGAVTGEGYADTYEDADEEDQCLQCLTSFDSCTTKCARCYDDWRCADLQLDSAAQCEEVFCSDVDDTYY